VERPPLNVLTVSSLYPSAVRPSFGVFVENRLRHLVSDTGMKATVIAPVPWFPFTSRLFGSYAQAARTPRTEKRNGLDVYHPRFLVVPKVGMRWTPATLYRAMLRQARALMADGLQVDVIDAHYLYPDGVAAVRLGRALDKPVILTARGSDVTEVGRLPGYHHRVMEAVAASAHTITVSNSLREELIAGGAAPDQITTLRNGVDCERFSPVQTAFPKAGEPKTILFVGWLIPRRRPDLVLGAAAQLPGVHVRLVGSGPEEASLRVLAVDLGIAGRVAFLGQQPPEAMPGHFSAADVLMLPSEREGWANVLLEAMACGTPVVSRAVAGALDLVTVPEAGKLVDSDDPADYAQAVRTLLDAPPARESVRAYASRFKWRDISLAQERIFREAMAAHGQPRQAGRQKD
jgi:glycosyltransferase involved in cell wall biosynthesis